jgi:hypothetical protein
MTHSVVRDVRDVSIVVLYPRAFARVRFIQREEREKKMSPEITIGEIPDIPDISDSISNLWSCNAIDPCKETQRAFAASSR